MNLNLKTVVPLGKSEKSIRDDPAFLISKVQPCPTSSGTARWKAGRGLGTRLRLATADNLTMVKLDSPFSSCKRYFSPRRKKT